MAPAPTTRHPLKLNRFDRSVVGRVSVAAGTRVEGSPKLGADSKPCANVTPSRHACAVQTKAEILEVEAVSEWLGADIANADRLARSLDDEAIVHVAEALRDEQRRRAIESGDQEAVISRAFDIGFGSDGLAIAPYVSAPFVVCPGSMVAKSKTNYRSRFINVDDCWIWESAELVREDKRSNPGSDEGFKAVALLPIIEGMALDQVTGRQRQGQYQAMKIVSYEIRGGELEEVSQRDIDPRRAPRRVG